MRCAGGLQRLRTHGFEPILRAAHYGIIGPLRIQQRGHGGRELIGRLLRTAEMGEGIGMNGVGLSRRCTRGW